MSLRIAESRHGAVSVLRPEGPFTAEAVEPLMAAFEKARGKSLGRVVLDCAAAPHADSEGLEALADLADQMARSGLSLKLIGCAETLRETFELTELTPQFEYFADANAAVRSFL
ncbi:MAG: STAS domain-containing protein [Planctomycetota bacterium]